MSHALPLDEMTTAEKLRMLERLWDDLCRTPEAVPSPAWHAPILHERAARVQQGEERIDEWADVKQRIRESLK